MLTDRAAATRAVLGAGAALLLCISVLLQACGETPAPDAIPPVEDARHPVNAADVAARVVANFLSVPVSEITLVSTEARNFGDPGLGCPVPGMSYAQVVTPGYRVVVEAEGRRFDVRVSGDSGRICRKPANKKPRSKPAQPPPDRTAPVTSQIERARASLAASLGLNVADIEIIGVRPFSPTVAAPGCRVDCAAGAADCGYLIRLYADGRRYEYHAGGGRITPCPELMST
ncbi:MAG: hypothetical protein ACE5G3_11845 [Gammaproteobacteria bacterium]